MTSASVKVTDAPKLILISAVKSGIVPRSFGSLLITLLDKKESPPIGGTVQNATTHIRATVVTYR